MKEKFVIAVGILIPRLMYVTMIDVVMVLLVCCSLVMMYNVGKSMVTFVLYLYVYMCICHQSHHIHLYMYMCMCMYEHVHTCIRAGTKFWKTPFEASSAKMNEVSKVWTCFSMLLLPWFASKTGLLLYNEY